MSLNPERRPARRAVARRCLASPSDLRFAAVAPLATEHGPDEKPTSANSPAKGQTVHFTLHDVFKMNVVIPFHG